MWNLGRLAFPNIVSKATYTAELSAGAGILTATGMQQLGPQL
jgi:hypothetical protein